MSRNGNRRPARPRIELDGVSPSPQEAAAITAAIEQFLRDTAPAPSSPGPDVDPWLRAGLLEATGRGPAGRAPWGRSAPWSS